MVSFGIALIFILRAGSIGACRCFSSCPPSLELPDSLIHPKRKAPETFQPHPLSFEHLTEQDTCKPQPPSDTISSIPDQEPDTQQAPIDSDDGSPLCPPIQLSDQVLSDPALQLV